MFPVLRLLQKVLYKMKKQKYYEQAPIFTEPAHKGKIENCQKSQHFSGAAKPLFVEHTLTK